VYDAHDLLCAEYDMTVAQRSKTSCFPLFRSLSIKRARPCDVAVKLLTACTQLLSTEMAIACILEGIDDCYYRLLSFKPLQQFSTVCACTLYSC